MTYKLLLPGVFATLFLALTGQAANVQQIAKLTYQGPIEGIDDDNYLVDPETTISDGITSSPTNFSVNQFFDHVSSFNTFARPGQWPDGGELPGPEIHAHADAAFTIASKCPPRGQPFGEPL